MKTNWLTKKLTEVCDIVYGFAFKANEFNEAGRGLPVIRIGDVDKDKTDKFFDGKYDEKYLINQGNILLGLSGSFKANRWNGEKALLNQRVATLRNFENKTSEGFVFYQLPRLFYDLERVITQLSVKNILTKHIEGLKILYPLLQIQKQIVERMDKIAEAQKLNDELIQKADELFQSLLHKELNPVGRDWEVRKLDEIAEIIMGQSPPSTSYNESGDGLPFFQGKADFGDLYPNTVKYCFSPSRIAESEDILISVRAPVGDINLAKVKSCIGRGLAAIRGNNKIIEQMYLYFLFKKSEKNWQKLSTGSTFAAITKDKLTNYKIPIPPLAIQKQIVAKLSAAQEYKKQLLEQKLKLEELFDSVLHKSMNGGFGISHS